MSKHPENIKSYSITNYNMPTTLSQSLLKRNIELQSSEAKNANEQFISA